MLIDRDDISDDIIALGTCFSMFVYIRADWQKSDSSVDEEPQGNWRWNSNSRDVLTSSPSFSHPATRVHQSAGSQARNHWQTPQLFNLNEGMKEESRLFCL